MVPMAQAGFAVFKYKHDGPSGISAKRLRVCQFSVLGGLILLWPFLPLGIALLVFALLAWLTAPKNLRLGPRYLICGDRVVYYGNVDKVVLETDAGRLTLSPAGGQPFVIERGRFPTNARKSHKVAANQAAKFGKVTAKLIERVRQASPAAEVVGAGRG